MTVHHYLCAPAALDAPGRLARCRALLTPDEQHRVDRYLRPEDQRLSLLARVMLRRALSVHGPLAPDAWRFEPNAWGRPELSRAHTPPAALGLRFNVSHTRDMVSVVVSAEREVGVDVEYTSRRGQTLEIADRFFAPSEVESLRALPAEAQRRRFFDHWTLKESYIKARGMGLAIPLHQFAFAFDSGTIRLTCDPALGDDGARWVFCQREPSPEHLVALAAHAPEGEAVVWRDHDGEALLP